ncbi:DUF3854 domain-containing protein [Scytonema sp. NUACC26]|uniref:DUF3854 domain-containing protein n=1 Tax=Scytonema sp. NUACC26 TaxID=3140176 RepID=UPI0034DC8F2E
MVVAIETTQITRNRFESFEDFQEFVRSMFIEGSAIDPELFEACVEFHQDIECDYGGEVVAPIHEALDWDYKRFRHQANEPFYAALLKNEDGSIWQAVVGVWDEGKQRPYTYLAPKGIGDRAFLPPIPENIRKRIATRYGIEVPLEGSFWEWLRETDIPRVTTEGGKKGLCLLSNGYVGIALYGCSCGVKTKDEDGDNIVKSLIPDLEQFAFPGSIWLSAFDQDEKHKAKLAVASGNKRRRTVLTSIGCKTADIVWNPEAGKGIDDLVVNNGSGALDAVYQEAVAKLSRQFSRGDKQELQKKLPPRRAAKELVERYRQQWKYDLERQTWRHWDKVWRAAPDEVFTQAVYRDLEALPNVDYGTFSYVENVVKFLKVELLEREWMTFNRMEWIAFNDCVLEVKTGKTHSHSPGFGFTNCLEHNYPKLVAIDPTSTLLEQLRINSPTFYSWAMHSQQGDPLKVLKLLAICNGVLKFRFFDLQMFVLLIGVPGAGKGAFARLLESMVGKPNCASAKLNKLGEDNVIAAIIDKQLVICPDEKKQASDYSGLLSLTGGDSIPYRPIYKPQANGKFYGSIVILGNSYQFYGDTTGIARRECLVDFPVALPTRDTSIEQKMQSEVGAIMALALSMPDQQVTDLIRGTGDAAIPDFKRQQWLHKTENDSVALFLEECLVESANDFITLGGEGNNRSTLYGAYLQMCSDNNSKSPFSRNNFRGHFLELCREIGWSGVRAVRQGNGWRIYGVSFRHSDDLAPRISDRLGGNVEEFRVCRPSVDPCVDRKPLPDKESVDCVGLTPPLSRAENFHQTSSRAPIEVDSSAQTSKSCGDDVPPHQVYTPTQSSQDKDLRSTQLNTQVYTPEIDNSSSDQKAPVGENATSSPLPSNETLPIHGFEVGQKVTVTRDSHPDKGRYLEVTQVGDKYIYCIIASGKKQGEARIYTPDEISPWSKHR